MKRPDIIEFWIGAAVALFALVMSNAIFWGSIYWLFSRLFL
jgi:hypothetical protein